MHLKQILAKTKEIKSGNEKLKLEISIRIHKLLSEQQNKQIIC